MPTLNQYSRPLYDNWNPQIAARLLNTVKNPSNTMEAASVFGNPNPRPARTAVYDVSLSGSGTQAYYVDPQEVKRYYPNEGMRLESRIGPNPMIALNPDVVRIYQKDPEFAHAVIRHEAYHGGQQGKLVLKQIYARSSVGNVPLGLWLIEGGVEWAIRRRGQKAPTEFFEKYSGRKSDYCHYRDFVEELEEKQHGIMRQVYRAAARGGPNAAIRLLESVPGIDALIQKYVAKLYSTESGTARYYRSAHGAEFMHARSGYANRAASLAIN